MGYLFLFLFSYHVILTDSIPPVPQHGDTSPGSIWPEPQKKSISSKIFEVDIENFNFVHDGKSKECFVVSEALKRYKIILSQLTPLATKINQRKNRPEKISSLTIRLIGDCEKYPHADMSEAYSLKVDTESFLQAISVWGILRGLETFSQLVHRGESGQIVVHESLITDFPRFKHRGILIDTARHFLPMDLIKTNLDTMAYNKFNVLHWHIVDEQSFPYFSKKFPELSAKGSYSPGEDSFVYTPNDIKEIVEYARLRGIRIIPEFDTPGHSRAWGYGRENLLTPCYKNLKPTGELGPMNPVLEENYEFLHEFFREIKSVFPDNSTHIGGDEVQTKFRRGHDCWQSNSQVVNWMQQHSMKQVKEVDSYHTQRILDINREIGYHQSIVWQEAFDAGLKDRQKDVVVEVWLDREHAKVKTVTSKGYRTIISYPWYLDWIQRGEDWKQYYSHQIHGTQKEKELIIGGEACLWGEYVDETNFLSRLWPRASAVAERLWSAESVNNVEAAAPRLHQHRCRMLERGIPAQPISTGYCTIQRRRRESEDKNVDFLHEMHNIFIINTHILSQFIMFLLLVACALLVFKRQILVMISLIIKSTHIR